MKDIQKESSKPNRTRRAIYVFGFTTIFAIAAFYATMYGEGPAVETFIKGALGIIELIAISYLVTTTVDRSEILSKLGNSMKSNDTEYGNGTYQRDNRTRLRQRSRSRYAGYEEDMSGEDGAMG